MRQIAALLGIIFALLNAYAAYLMASRGLELVSKEMVERGLLVAGGVTVGLFAVILAGQCLRLLVSRGPRPG
jgi:hypothetical protein